MSRGGGSSLGPKLNLGTRNKAELGHENDLLECRHEGRGDHHFDFYWALRVTHLDRVRPTLLSRSPLSAQVETGTSGSVVSCQMGPGPLDLAVFSHGLDPRLFAGIDDVPDRHAAGLRLEFHEHADWESGNEKLAGHRIK
jgi:hypothetical protein